MKNYLTILQWEVDGDYISKLGYDENNPEIQLPTEKIAGDSSTYVTDYFNARTGGQWKVFSGVSWLSGRGGKIWCINLRATSVDDTKHPIYYRLIHI